MNHQDGHGATSKKVIEMKLNKLSVLLTDMESYWIASGEDIEERGDSENEALNNFCLKMFNGAEYKTERAEMKGTYCCWFDVWKVKSRAADMAKSRANAAGYIRDARLTERAAKSLDSLCVEWGMNKTQVINKLLEEQEQRQMF